MLLVARLQAEEREVEVQQGRLLEGDRTDSDPAHPSTPPQVRSAQYIACRPRWQAALPLLPFFGWFLHNLHQVDVMRHRCKIATVV